MMKRIYLAGQVTGRHYSKVYRDFADAKQFLLSQGFDEVVNPCELVVPGTTWTDAMMICIPYLATCNFMALLPGYERSKGAMCEYYFALGMENEGTMQGIIHINVQKPERVTLYNPQFELTETLNVAI